MKEILRTNNAVALSYATALLEEAGIEAVILDGHTSAVEGSIGAIQRRLMVREADQTRAEALLDQNLKAEDRARPTPRR
ncbi:MAG TPA: DUF2007 domain-containing protein [Alphaproteobacteria bacterium]|nr:DUF2007 domain-containing protein [Alphaproteobacteria bacterium]